MHILTLTPTYFRPGTLHNDDGITSERPFDDGGEEWILIDGTPASCAQIGLHYLFKDRGPIDLVVSGPNYGRNTTAVFALSSGTIGGAMESAMNGTRSIALSYAFDSRIHDPEIISAASKLSTQLIEKLVKDWPEDVHLYSVNVPLRKGVENTKILYTEMLQNRWINGSSFKELPEEADDVNPNVEEQAIRDGDNSTNGTVSKPPRRAHRKFKWSPTFADVHGFVADAKRGDGWEVSQGNVTVTPLIANFWHLPHYTGEIKLDDAQSDGKPTTSAENQPQKLNAVVAYPDAYVQPLLVQALEALESLSINFISSLSELPSATDSVLQFSAYESLDFEHALQYPKSSLVCAYVIRKALIRKHYLSNTISTWLVKHQDSTLAKHFQPCVHFELDYAEFLDDALVDAWDLKESMAKNDLAQSPKDKQWWILKPGMSDGGNGIRLFSSIAQLQSIFEEWEEQEDSDSQEGDEDGIENEDSPARSQGQDKDKPHDEFDGNAMTSQLRHFIAQPYIDPPLLLDAYGQRKFHIRTYVLAVGALKVYVYREMLALFAALPYQPPSKAEDIDLLDLSQHLTNTCFQDESTKSSSVHAFWGLEFPETMPETKERIFEQICEITGDVFEAAAREQMVHFQTLPNAFEIFGVDFLVDTDANIWLLELNAYPDFKQTGRGLQDKIVGGLFKEAVAAAVLPFLGIEVDEKSNLPLVRQLDLGRG
ncbi:hypothetical protein LTR84_010364 [Exophiala bonariae]|uniref:Survival protein SurE-like phosphatase/nucleotidase domain-containing protein n=1 Tax=Exophiala bonariae TaxID=1690606 RepID=A0AAV9MW85_9EURO|nr:hypothetical protein LTR84_010364 [Exophiala bonariae]